MKLIKLLWIKDLGIFTLTFYLLIACNSSNSDNSLFKDPKSTESYISALTSQRKAKDAFFRTNPESPLENKAGFSGLSYFPVSTDYYVVARFEPFADKTQKLVVTLSDGSEEVYEKHGHAVFKLRNEVCRLLILKHEDTYSVLFRDNTSGKSTYGGGRYIDLDEKAFAENQVTIDFNEAYNPYCVYNHNYACPLPPKENTLPIAVEAGEKVMSDE